MLPLRRLGQTELLVSEVGFGAWQLGNGDQWGGMTDALAHNLVHQAIDLGCNLFDTAPNYALSHSERLLGEALQGKRDKVVIVSKFGHQPGGGLDFSADGFWRSLHGSLARLKTDYLDVFLAHSPPMDVLNGQHEIWPALRVAQQQGKIRHYGASVDYAHEVRETLQTTDAQVLELMFNVLHQDVRLAFDLVRQHDIGVITKVPLDSGWLSGKYHAQSTFDGVRARWDATEVRRRAACIDDLQWLVSADRSLGQQALAYLLSYAEVTAVIPGIRSSEQLQTNFSSAGLSLNAVQRSKLEQYWNSLTTSGQQLLPW